MQAHKRLQTSPLQPQSSLLYLNYVGDKQIVKQRNKFYWNSSVAPVLALRATKFATAHLDVKTTSARVGVIKVHAILVTELSTLLVRAVEPKSQFRVGAKDKPNLQSVHFHARKYFLVSLVFLFNNLIRLIWNYLNQKTTWLPPRESHETCLSRRILSAMQTNVSKSLRALRSHM